MDKRWKFDPGPLADSIAAHAEACGLTRAQMLRVMVYLFDGPPARQEVGYNRELMKDWLTNDKLRLTVVDEEGRRTDKDGNPKSGPTTGPSVDPGLGWGPDFGFDEFYEAYPRKVGKGDARKAWRQLYKVRPDVLTIAGRAKLMGEHVKDKSKIPYPATWLRRHGWEDELSDVADGSGPMTEREKRAAAGGDPAASAPERKRFDNPYGSET